MTAGGLQARRECYRLALDGLSAELRGDATTRYAVVGDLLKTSEVLGGGHDLVVIVETIMSVAASIGDHTGQPTSAVLLEVVPPGGTDARGSRLQADLLAAAVIMAENVGRGSILALEHAGWTQARVEGLRVCAAVVRLYPHLVEAVIGDLPSSIDPV